MIFNISHNMLTHFNPNQKNKFPLQSSHFKLWDPEGGTHSICKIMFLVANLNNIYYLTYRYFCLQSWASLQFEEQPYFIPVFRDPHEDIPSWAKGSLKLAITTDIAHGAWQLKGSAIWACGVTNKDFLTGHPGENTAHFSGLTSSKYTLFQQEAGEE